MGCWNATCAISNLPITDNNPVKLIFLQGKYSYSGISGFYSPDSCMAPAFYDIDAIYDDYGSVKKITEDWNTKLITEYFIKRYGKKIKHHHSTKKERGNKVDTTIESVANLIERGLCGNNFLPEKKMKRLSKAPNPDTQKTEYLKWLNEYCNHSLKSNEPLSFTLIRKDVWDEVIKIMSEYKIHFWGNNFDHKYEDGKLELKIGLQKEFNHKIKTSIEYSEKFNEYAKNKTSEFPGIGHELSPFKYNTERENVILHNQYYEAYLTAFKENNQELIDQIFNKWMELDLINSFMSYTRKAWSVHPGAGSQSTNFDIYSKFFTAMNKIATEEMKEYDYDEEEDFEDEIVNEEPESNKTDNDIFLDYRV